MRYIYSSFKTNPDTADVRLSTTTSLNDIELEEVMDPNYVEVYDPLDNRVVNYLKCEDDLLAWRTAQERAAAWKPIPEATKEITELMTSINKTIDSIVETNKGKKTPDKINPKHYKDFVEGLQWIEMMCRIPRYRDNPEAFKGAVELQVRKYLDRNGRKDNELQELEKALWYMKFYVAYIKSGCKPINVSDIDRILSGK